MASSASLCRRYRPPVLDTRMVTSGPEKWRSATALTPPPAAATASATSGDAHASMSSKSADSAGGVRPQPTVMRNAALLLGAAASQKSASGSATSTTCERMSPPRPVVYAAHSVAVALGATQADPGMSVNETVEGLFGSDETCGTTTVGASHVSGGGSRKWSSTSDRDDAPPTYERDTLKVSVGRAPKPPSPPESLLGTCVRMDRQSAGSARAVPPLCSRMMAASERCSRAMAS
mmetsp:Transcript_38529/g.114326  ORF Transcript_38529/g.114326 Transcript_38529/m.114326 type:complete len:234 (-) Transcript_38529:2416-3117(-)